LGNNSIKTLNFEINFDLKIRGEQQTTTSVSLSSWYLLLKSNFQIEISFKIGSFCGRNTPRKLKEASTNLRLPLWHNLATALVRRSKIDLYLVCLHAHQAFYMAFYFRCLLHSGIPSELLAPDDKWRCNPLDVSAMRIAYYGSKIRNIQPAIGNTRGTRVEPSFPKTLGGC